MPAINRTAQKIPPQGKDKKKAFSNFSSEQGFVK